MKFMNLGESAHTYETVIQHDEWDEMKILIENDPRQEEPSIEFEIDADPKNPQRIKMLFSELEKANQIVANYKAAQEKLKGGE